MKFIVFRKGEGCPEKLKIFDVRVVWSEWSRNEFNIYNIIIHVFGRKNRLISSTETAENIETYKKANENIGVCWNNIDTFASLYISK